MMRRLHSLTGLWLVLYLIEHLLTNSQAALFFGDNGNGFVKAVNFIYSLPYLPVIEVLLLGVPFVIHGIWGVQRALEARSNIVPTDGAAPALGEYPRNRAFTWQRMTSWLLLVGIIAHVVQMRFMDYPVHVWQGGDKIQIVRLNMDPGLYTLSQRLGVTLYDEAAVRAAVQSSMKATPEPSVEIKQTAIASWLWGPPETTYSTGKAHELQDAQGRREKQAWASALMKKPLQPGEVLAATPEFGKAVLLTVRDTFKMPSMVVLYTLFVIAATYHAFNGLWTGLITWGITLNERSQRIARIFCYGLMFLVTFLGLAAIWGTYWINLKN